jgi:hypothetical protein
MLVGTKTIITGSQNTGVYLKGSNQTLVVAKNGTISATDGFDGINSQFLTDNNHIIVNGKVFATFGEFSYGTFLQSSDSSVTVGGSGQIVGNHIGISVFAHGADIDNAGIVQALGAGGLGLEIDAYNAPSDGTTVHNIGTISGDTAVSVEMNGTLTNEVHGRILGQTHAFDIGAGNLTLINHGLVKSTEDSTIFDRIGANQYITNDGTIVGDLDLGAGDDVLDARGGSIKGTVNSGVGDDILITNNAKIQLNEFADEGTDWVRSAVSYTLSDNVEVLSLLGKKNINAIGNNDADVNNFIYGNAGDNVLNGLGGFNKLSGLGGTDTLISAAGSDEFVLSKGCDRDTAKGYTDGTDSIDIDLNGIANFGRVKSHIEQHGHDTWIKFGKDILILENVDHKVLDANDFLFHA